MRARLSAALLVAVALGAPAPAGAQHALYRLPVEKALLESHIELEFEYSHPAYDPVVHRTVISLEGQLALANRIELGLNVPFLDYSFKTSDEAARVDLEDAQLGDPILGLKLRLFSTERLALAAHLNTTLPLHSGYAGRSYTVLQPGAGLALLLGRLTVGATLVGLWYARGDDDPDVAYLGADLYAAYRPVPRLALRLAVQFLTQLHPDPEVQVLGLTPGVELLIWSGLYAELASRIAPTEYSRALFGGWASVLFSTGWRF